MKKLLPLTILLCGLAAGCGAPGPKTTVTDPQGNKLTVAAPVNPVTVRQGAEEKFAITARREGFDAPVELTFDNPLKGVKIEGKTTIPVGKSDTILTLKAAKDAETKADVVVKVTAKSSGFESKVTVTFKVTIQESLENKAARRDAFVAEAKKRLEKIQQDFKKMEMQIPDAQDDFKDKFLKRYRVLNKDVAQAKKKLDDLSSSELEVWEQLRPGVESALSNLEASVQSATKDLQGHLKEKKKKE